MHIPLSVDLKYNMKRSTHTKALHTMTSYNSSLFSPRFSSLGRSKRTPSSNERGDCDTHPPYRWSPSLPTLRDLLRRESVGTRRLWTSSQGSSLRASRTLVAAIACVSIPDCSVRRSAHTMREVRFPIVLYTFNIMSRPAYMPEGNPTGIVSCLLVGHG